MLKNNKNGLGIWWTGTCHQNLVSIHLIISEKTTSTDGQTDEGRPRHDSRFSVQLHKAELKNKSAKIFYLKVLTNS